MHMHIAGSERYVKVMQRKRASPFPALNFFVKSAIDMLVRNSTWNLQWQFILYELELKRFKIPHCHNQTPHSALYTGPNKQLFKIKKISSCF